MPSTANDHYVDQRAPPAQCILSRWAVTAARSISDAVVSAGSWCFERRDARQQISDATPQAHFSVPSAELVNVESISRDVPRLVLSCNDRHYDPSELGTTSDESDAAATTARRWSHLRNVVCAVAKLAREDAHVEVVTSMPPAAEGSQALVDIHSVFLAALRRVGAATVTAKVLMCCTQGRLFLFVAHMQSRLRCYWSPRWDMDWVATTFDAHPPQVPGAVSIVVRHKFISRNDAASTRTRVSSSAVPSIEVTWEAVVRIFTAAHPSVDEVPALAIEWSTHVLDVTDVSLRSLTHIPWYVRGMRRCIAPLARARCRELSRRLHTLDDAASCGSEPIAISP